MGYVARRQDRTRAVTDSLGTDFGGVGASWWSNGFREAYQGHYRGAPNPTPTSRELPNAAPELDFPFFSVNGGAGRKWGDISGDPMALVPADTTSIIAQMGVNDAFAQVPNVTLEPQVQNCLDVWAANGITRVLLVGPLSHGEHWPSPSVLNDRDADIDRVDLLLDSIVAANGPTYGYVSWRRNVFNVYEPIYNPTNLGSQVLTVDGTHLNRTYSIGEQLCVQAILNQVTFA